MSLCYKAEVLRVRLHFLHHSKNFLFGWNIYHTNRSIPTNYYNLDVIISVGYRVNSIQATKFRIWATGILKEYMIKGFAMDDERLKQGKTAFGKDYFRELLERVRSIRASERRIWQQITDILQCAALIMIEIPIPHIIFMPLYRINSTMPLSVKQRQKLCIIGLTTPRKIWA